MSKRTVEGIVASALLQTQITASVASPRFASRSICCCAHASESHAQSPRRFVRTRRPRLLSTTTQPKPPPPCATGQARSLATAAAPSKEYAVIGGGITGLTTAYYLAKYQPDARVTLYESSDRLGGWIRTERVPVTVDGVRKDIQFEWGPRAMPEATLSNCWRFDDLVMWDLLKDLGLKLTVQAVPPMKRWVYFANRLNQVPPPLSELLALVSPGNLMQGLPSTLARIKLKQLQSQTHLQPPDEDMSVTEWLTHIGVSQYVVDNMVSAMIHGIHGGDPDKLSARLIFDSLYWRYYTVNTPGGWVMPQELDIIDKIGSVIDPKTELGAAARRRTPIMLHFGHYGMQTLPNSLASVLGTAPNVSIKLQQSIKDISLDDSTQRVALSNARGETSLYDDVVCAVSSSKLASITKDKLAPFSKVHSTSMWTVSLWYPYQAQTTQGLGYLIPRSVSREDNPYRVLGVMFDHNLGTGGPDEHPGTKLFVLMGGHFYDSGDVAIPTTAEQAIDQAKATVAAHLGMDNSTLRYSAARFADECIPQLHVGHQDLMMQAHESLQRDFAGHLVAAGGSFSRPGVLPALRAGFDAANQVLGRNQHPVGTGVQRNTVPVELSAEKAPRTRETYEQYFHGGLTKFLRWGLK